MKKKKEKECRSHLKHDETSKYYTKKKRKHRYRKSISFYKKKLWFCDVFWFVLRTFYAKQM